MKAELIQKSRAKLREERGPEVIKAAQNKNTKQSRAKSREDKLTILIKVISCTPLTMVLDRSTTLAQL